MSTARLSGKLAIVTGASAGIGAATARALAREGADLVVSARRKERLTALAAELQAESGMLEPSDVADAVALACAQSPGARIIEIQMRTMAEALA